MTESTLGTTPPPMTFGLRLRALRLAAGVRQHELATRVNVGFPYISKIEKADGPIPAPDLIAKIAAALRLTDAETAELFQLAERMPPAVERLMVNDREAMDFYRAAHRRLPDDKRRAFFLGLIEQLEREGDDTPSAADATGPTPDGEAED